MSDSTCHGRSETRVHRVCSWCSAILDTSRTSWQGQAEMKTHGVCRSCFFEVRLRDQLASAAFSSGQARFVAG
jgi:hypothetical protein